MKKSGRRRWAIAAVALVVIAAGVGTGVYLMLRDGGSQTVEYLTSEVTTGTVSEAVEADFSLTSARSGTTLTPGASGIVTAVDLAEGDRLRSLQRLAVISGQQVFALVSNVPLYRELSVGDSGANVKALEVALKKQSYEHGAVDGTFDSSTEQGLIDWQSDHNLDETGTVDLTTFVWVPAGSVVASVDVVKGSTLGGKTGLATVTFPRKLKVQAQVGQSDVSLLEKGQEAQLVVDGHEDETIAATITAIANEPTSSAAAAGTDSTSGTVQYAIDLALDDVPSWALSGMTGSLTVVVAQHADVLVVPTSAVAGSASDAYVRLLVDGAPVDRTIETGMATATLTEVSSGLSEGETVITGEVVDGGSTDGEAQSGGLGVPGMRSGPPDGGGQMRQGGGQAGGQ